MKGFLGLVCLLALMSNCESDVIVRQRQINGRIKTYYKLTGTLYDFNSAVDWCHGLGGQLPIILTKEELNFLAVSVIVKDDQAETGNFMTWMGLQKENGHCFNWLDGTRVNMSFRYYSRCESCTASCCAMIMWNQDDLHRYMVFRDCNQKAKAICVFDDEKTVVLPKDPAYLTKLYGELNGSLNNLSQNTENNFDHIKLNISELQSLAMKEHIETKKILDETRHKLSETENKLKKLQTWIDDHIDIKEIDGLKKSSSTSNILHWTSLGMIGCLAVILAVVGYRTRRNSLPATPEPSVTYVAEEEILNFSSGTNPSANINVRVD